MSKERKIIHVDMDAFFASVEQRDNPELRGKPIAVGGGGKRGVVAAASYEARQFGVRSAMPGITAIRLCPELIFVRHRFDAYKEVSQQIRSIFLDYTDLVEPLSLDEAYLDVTENKKGLKSATLIAEEIRQRIFQETQLTASAGVSINKFVAKVASDENKPNGLTLIAPDQVDEFVKKLPVERFFGIGKVTAEKLKRRNIHTGEDLRQFTRPALVKMFGKSGAYYFNICRGIDFREVKPNRLPKSVSCEETYSENLADQMALELAIHHLTERLWERTNKKNIKGKTVTLKIKYADFKQQTRSVSQSKYYESKEEVFQTALQLLSSEPLQNEIRLLGLGVSNLNLDYATKGEKQLTLNF
ncbi:MAG: DNA polymerase IV [Bacteroidota bacterium]